MSLSGVRETAVRALQHLPPEALDAYPCEGKIVSRPVLGGLINDYCRLAA